MTRPRRPTKDRMILSHYAPGDGSIDLVWQELSEDGRILAASRQVTRSEAHRHLHSRDARHLLEKGYRVVEHCGRFILAANVKRLMNGPLNDRPTVNGFPMAGILEINGEPYNYSLDPQYADADRTIDAGLHVEFFAQGQWHLLRNWSMRDTIRFFLDNEKQLTPA